MLVTPHIKEFSRLTGISVEEIKNDSINLAKQFALDREPIKAEPYGCGHINDTYCVYAAASLYACGTLFNTVLGMEPKMAMIIATVVIVFYTFCQLFKKSFFL